MKKINTRKIIANIIYILALTLMLAGFYYIGDDSSKGTILLCSPCPLIMLSNCLKRSVNN